MSFFRQADKGNNYWGAYVLTLIWLFVALVGSAMLAESLAQSVLGQSLSLPLQEGVSKNAVLLLNMLPFVMILVTLLLCVRFLHKRPIKSVITIRDKYDWKRFFTSFGIWFAVLLTFLFIDLAGDAPIVFQWNPSSFFPLLLIALLLIPLQTAAEDVLFRGYIFQGLGRVVKNAFMTVVIGGGIFGWLHSGNPEVEVLGKGILVYYILSGVFLGLLAHLDDGLELGMGYHAANNIFGTLIVTSNWQALQSEALFVDYSIPEFGWDSILTIALIQPLLLVVFAKIYRWKGVKDKLIS